MKSTKSTKCGNVFGFPLTSARESKGADAIGGSQLSNDLAESLQAELAENYQVVSPVEIDAVAALALALAKWMEIESVKMVKIAQERAAATVRFDRLVADAFDRDKAAWQKDPETRISIFARTFRGASHLSEIWARVLKELKSGADIPFELACHALLCMGSRWQVDKADENAMTIMASFVKISSDPTQAAETWARESKMRDGLSFARRRAEKAVARAPGADQCRSFLVQAATQEAEGWKKVADKMRADFEAARAASCDFAVGLGTGDPVLEKELRILNRLAIAARDRADKLQEKLEALIMKRNVAGVPVTLESNSGERAKSNGGRVKISLCAGSHSPVGSISGVKDSNVGGMMDGSGSNVSARDFRSARGPESGSKKESSFHENPRTIESRKDASNSEVTGEKHVESLTSESRADAGPSRLTSSERKLVKMLRKVPDSPRRRSDIVRLFGSEQRFREMCAAIDSR